MSCAENSFCITPLQKSLLTMECLARLQTDIGGFVMHSDTQNVLFEGVVLCDSFAQEFLGGEKLFVCIHTRTCIYICIYIYKYTYIYIYTYIYTHVYMSLTPLPKGSLW